MKAGALKVTRIVSVDAFATGCEIVVVFRKTWWAVMMILSWLLSTDLSTN